MTDNNKDKLHEAVKLVNDAIMAEYKRIEEIAKTEEGDPISSIIIRFGIFSGKIIPKVCGRT